MGNIQSNKEFIEKICAETWKDLYRFIYYKVQNREEAEDITQETYAKAISYLNKNEVTILEYSSYLKAISMNIIRDQWRGKKRKGRSVNLDDINPEEAAAEDFSDLVNDRAQIEDALERVTQEQRMVIDLRILKGYSVAETARLMKKKEGTVRVLQFRAIKALAQIMDVCE